MQASGEMAALKRDNRMVAFELLLQRKLITKSEICAVTGLSAPTVMKIFDFFESNALTCRQTPQKDENVRCQGRKPAFYCLDSQRSQTLCILYEGTLCKTALVALDGRIIEMREYPSTDNLERFLSDDMDRILHAYFSAPKGYIRNVGVSLPAIIHQANVFYAPYFSIKKTLSVQNMLDRWESEYHVPFCIENDVNACAIGEFYARSEQNLSNMAYIALNDGIGAGIIINKQLYRGSHGFAGEIGYFNTDIHGFGSFSERGALESRLDQALIDTRWPSGDENLVRDRIAYLADHLSLLISDIQYTIDLDLFVLGGHRMKNYGVELVNAINSRLTFREDINATCCVQQCMEPTISGIALLSRQFWLNQLFLE